MHWPPGEVWNSSQLAAGARLIMADCVWPFNVAVTVAFWLLLAFPATAAKAVLLLPAGTVTLEGTESNPLMPTSDTIVALVGASLSVTVQVVDALLASAEGAQDSDVICSGPLALAVSVKVWEAPFKVAVSTAV